MKFTAKAEGKKREKKLKYKAWLIDAKNSLKEFLNISLDFFYARDWRPNAAVAADRVQGEVEGGKSEKEEKRSKTAMAVQNKEQNNF